MELGGAAGGGSVRKKPATKRYTGNRGAGGAAVRRSLSSNSSRTSGSFNTPSYRTNIKSNSSGSYGGTPSATPNPPAASGPGPVPSINSYLGGDSGYGQQLRQLAKSLNDFNADATRRRGVLTSEYGVSKKALGDQRGLDLDALEEDYGSRGLLRSGLYGDAVGDYEKEYGLRAGDLDRRQQQALQQLLQESSAFGQQNTLSKQAAREAAIRRRAEKYGV